MSDLTGILLPTQNLFQAALLKYPVYLTWAFQNNKATSNQTLPGVLFKHSSGGLAHPWMASEMNSPFLCS